jgi:hypothetical protein
LLLNDASAHSEPWLISPCLYSKANRA